MTPPAPPSTGLHLPSPAAALDVVDRAVEQAGAHAAAGLVRSAIEHLDAATGHAVAAREVDWVSRAAAAYGADLATAGTLAAGAASSLRAAAASCAAAGAGS